MQTITNSTAAISTRSGVIVKTTLTDRVRHRLLSVLLTGVAAVASMLAPDIATADSVEETLLRPSYYTRSLQNFGHAIDLHENRLIVGAPKTRGTGDAYIYERSQSGDWFEKKRLLPPSSMQSVSRFGKSVAIIDGFAFVGANATIEMRRSDSFYPFTRPVNTGVVFVYKRTGLSRWTFERVLLPGGGETSYADSIAVEPRGENFALVAGTPFRRDPEIRRNTGAAYVHEPFQQHYPLSGIGYTTAVIYPELPTMQSEWEDPDKHSMRFGYDVDIDNGKVLIGAPNWVDSEGRPTRNASAYLYEKQSGYFLQNTQRWQEVQKMQLIGASRNYGYGYSVALQGDRAVVGNPCLYPQDCRGEAHVFERAEVNNLFTHTADLTPFERMTEDHFGSSVALHDMRILVAGRTGTGYLFKRVSDDDWNRLENWGRSNANIWASEPSSIAINERFFAIGRRYDEVSSADSSSTDTGRTQTYRLDEFLPPVFEPVCQPLDPVCTWGLNR